jgi:hypothetical protein
VISLNEVVVEPVQAEKLLRKACENLIKSYNTDKSGTSYLLHIDESTSADGEREAYALIEANRTKPTNKKHLYWNIDLCLLDILKNVNDSSFYLGKHPIYIGIFIKEFSIGSIKNYHCEISDNEDDKITIKLSPKKAGRRYYRYYLYTINKSDTVLTGFVAQSYFNSADITSRKIKGGDFQVLNHYSETQFVLNEHTHLYNIHSMQHICKIRLSSTSHQNDINCSVTVLHVKSLDNYPQEKKKIGRWDNILFKTDFPTSKDFWKKYVEKD